MAFRVPLRSLVRVLASGYGVTAGGQVIHRQTVSGELRFGQAHGSGGLLEALFYVLNVALGIPRSLVNAGEGRDHRGNVGG